MMASADMPSGVPQGLLLGPTFVLIFIGDLATNMADPRSIFANEDKLSGEDLDEDNDAIKSWSL